ncbi:hypothetical protein MAPG_01386, partial [Magnaporthiopsis poae ATCC 64411]
MATRTSLTGVVVALLGILLALYQTGVWFGNSEPAEKAPLIIGRNNTVLFLFAEHHGFANVNLAAALSLQQRHPQVEVHAASFAVARARVGRVSTGPRPITFHEVKGANFVESLEAHGINTTTLIHRPGLRGSLPLFEQIPQTMSPWSVEDHIAIYQQVRRLIDQVDPAIIVLDIMFRPATEAVEDSNRMHVVLTPNDLSPMLAPVQPYGQVFWKYPVFASGFAFPVPWRNVPENVLMFFKSTYAILFPPGLGEKRRRLREEGGIRNPLDFTQQRRD